VIRLANRNRQSVSIANGSRGLAPRQLPALCDFCGDSHPVVHFPCLAYGVWLGDYDGHAFFYHHDGSGWAACLDCAGLIYEDRWDDLVARAVRGLRARRLKTQFAIPVWLARLYAPLRDHLVWAVQ
jgi:hypothetical protein